MGVNVSVKERGNSVLIKFDEYVHNGWAIVGCVTREIDLDRGQVISLVERLSEWLKKQEGKINGKT